MVTIKGTIHKDLFPEIETQLIRDEGVKLYPYVDTAGKITIGIGRNLTDMGLSFEEVGILFRHDMDQAVRSVLHYLEDVGITEIDYPRFAVLVNMVFNMGLTRVKSFQRFLAALGAHDYLQASRELLNSRWASQVGERAVKLASQMREGKFLY